MLNAVYGSPQTVKAMSAANQSAVSRMIANQNKQATPSFQGQNAGLPNFGIKGREPLTQDMFEYKGEKLSKEDARKKSYDDVYKHEAAHLAKAGKYATTGICIDYDGNGFATSGHVGIAMPKLNKSNPKETIDHAEAVIASAEAPSGFDELSDADKNVAATARAVKAQAQQALNSKSLNLIA